MAQLQSHQSEQPLRALFWMALSATGFSLMAFMVKVLAPAVPQFQLVFFRSVVNLLVVIPWMLWTREPLIPAHSAERRLLILRGFAGFGGLSCLFYTVSHLPLSISMLLGWSSPIFVILFSRFFLHETLNKAQLGGILIAFLGMILLVLRPESQTQATLAARFALPLVPFVIGIIGAAFSGLAYVAVRAATAKVGVNTIILYFTGVSTLLSAPLAAHQFVMPSFSIAVQLVLLGLFASFGQFTMTQGFRFAPAGVVSSMSLLNAALSAGLGWFLLDERLNSIQWVGLWVLAGSVLFLGLLRRNPS